MDGVHYGSKSKGCVTLIMLMTSYISQGCYLDECQWLALVQVDSGTYTGVTESLE